MTNNTKHSNYQGRGIKDLVLALTHNRLDTVRLVAIEENEATPGTDPIYTSQAIVVDSSGVNHFVPLWELWYRQQLLPLLIINREEEKQQQQQQEELQYRGTVLSLRLWARFIGRQI